MRIIKLSLLSLAGLCLLAAVMFGLRSLKRENPPESLLRSMTLERDNYNALKLRAKLQLTNHQFAEALQTTRQAQAFRDDDHDVWGMITDALVNTGDYEGAVKAAQRMIDLRPDSSSYSRVSYLRELHGDTEGAIQAMTLAVKAANPNDPEGLAWYRAQLQALRTGTKHPHTH
jgi:predicted Zn-dependent protease